jgi:hypothetical protein
MLSEKDLIVIDEALRLYYKAPMYIGNAHDILVIKQTEERQHEAALISSEILKMNEELKSRKENNDRRKKGLESTKDEVK